MDPNLLRVCHRLNVALDQTENALNNLLSIERWADQHNHPHLALGVRDLSQHLGRFRLDLASLTAVVRSQAQSEKS